MVADAARRFIEAFNDIENHFRSASGNDEHVPFAEMAREYAAERRLPHQVRDALSAFARLRNAISHEKYLDGAPIAEPRPDVIDQIERLRDIIVSPPAALAVVAGGEVAMTKPDTPVSAALQVMRKFDYSQLPVYDGDQYAGILTTNAIARWLAGTLADNDGLAEAEPVAAVLKCAEAHECALHVAKAISASDALHKLSSGGEGGKPVAALIVTHSGKATEKPVGIIVDDDIPALVTALSVD